MERSPLRASRVVGGVGSPCVGEGRGVGAKATRVEFPDSRSADARIELDAPSSVVVPLSSPSPTYACVKEGMGNGARAAKEKVGAEERFGDVGSADAGFTDAATKGAGDGRLASHGQAGPSPKCTWGWLDKQLKELKALIIGCSDSPGALCVDWSIELHRFAVCHVVGRTGKTLQRIEDVCGVFLALHDVDKAQSKVRLWGSPEGVALAVFVVEALERGMHSILDSLGRLGF